MSQDAELALRNDTLDTWVSSRESVGGFEKAQKECGFEGCNGGWLAPWKRRTRPMFEGQWACSRECLRGLVQAAVHREMQGSDGEEVAEGHHHRVPLGLVLLAQGLVTESELKRALTAQRSAGRGRIGEWLVESCGVSERRVTRGLGLQWKCPVVGTAGFVAETMALAMPVELRRMCGVLPLRVAGGQVFYLAFDNEVDAAADFALERMSGLRVESCLVRGGEFRQAMEEMEACKAVACREVKVRSRTALVDGVVKELQALQPVASRVVRLRNRYWLRMWLERGAIGSEGTLPRTGEDALDTVFRMETM